MPVITDKDKQVIDQVLLAGRVDKVLGGDPNADTPRGRLPLSQRLLTTPPVNALFDFLSPEKQSGPSRVVKNLAVGGPAPMLKTIADFLDNPMRLSPAGAALEQAGLIKQSPTAEAIRQFAQTGEEGLAVKDPGFVDALTQGAGSMITAAGPGMLAGRAAMLAGPQMALPTSIAVPSVMEAAQEGTQAKERALQKGMTPEQASKAERFAATANLPLLGITNAVGPIGDIMKKAMGEVAAEGIIKGLIKDAVMEGPLQEGPQQVIGNIATGDPAMDGVAQATAIGSILGGGTGAAVGATNVDESKAELAQVKDAVGKIAGAAKQLPAKAIELNKRLGNSGQAVVPFGGEQKPVAENPPAEPFYSKLEKTIQEKMPNMATPEQVRGILANNGVKQDEIDWTDVEGALEGKDKVSKKELLDHIQSNNVQIKEVMHGGDGELVKYEDLPKNVKSLVDRHDNGDIDQGEFQSKLKKIGYNAEFDMSGDLGRITKIGDTSLPTVHSNSNLNLPGGKNYREMLLTMLPQSESLAKRAMDTFGAPLDQLSNDEREELAQTTAEGKSQIFSSTHFSEPNILAHVRMNDRTDSDGKKVLFVEEVQSDWHQKGRKEGYKPKSLWTVRDEGNNLKGDKFKSKEDAEKFVADHGAQNWKVYENTKISGVPDAPFKKTWHEMAMKRVLRYAAEKGYDRVAWTTGEQQNERYDLSKQVTSIEAIRRPNGEYILRMIDRNGQRVNANEQTANVPPANLADFVGKDLAEKIVKQPEESHVYSGIDLKVGGEGMKGFYDQMIPAFMSKYTKKWGGKVDKSKIEAGTLHGIEEIDGRKKLTNIGKDFRDVHSVDITPAMRQSIMTEGQTLFEKGAEVDYNSDESLKAFGSAEAAKGAINEAIKEAENPKESVFNNRPTPEILRQEAKARKEIAKQLRQRGFVDYRGIKVESIEDVADLARLFRNPKVEHLQALMFKDGVLVAHRVVSSGLVNAVGANAKYVNSIAEAAKRLGANEVFFAHNHPTGHPKPSQEDIKFTTVADEMFYEQGVSLNGHIVTDGDKYAFITNRGSFELKNFRKPMDNPAQFNAPSMSSPDMVFENARAFVKHGLTTVIFLNARNQIVGVDAIKKYENSPSYIKSKKSFYDASSYIVMFADPVNVEKLSKRMPPGLLDIISVTGKDKFSSLTASDNASFKSEFIDPKEQMRWRRKLSGIYPIQEEQASYDPQGWDEELNIPQFEPSQQDLADKAQMELEMMAYTGSLHPLEKAIQDVGKIAPNKNGKELEEYKEIPKRFRDPNGKPIDEVRQELSNNHGLDFDNDSDLRQALKALGDTQRRFIMSKDVQDFLKVKENVDKMGKILSKSIPAQRYKQIINSNVGIRQKKKPQIIKMTEEKAFKELLRAREKASKQGFAAGKKEAQAEAKKDAQALRKEFTAIKEQIKEKFGEKAREQELKTLKDDIIKRNVEKLRSELVDYIQETVEPRLRGRFLRTVQNVRTARNMERAVEMVTRTQKRFDESAERREMYEAIMDIKTDKMSDFNKEAIKEIQQRVGEYRRGGMGEEKLEKLHRLRNALQKDPENDLPDYVIEQLEELEKKPFKELSTDELRALFLSAMQYSRLERLKQVIRIGQREREYNEVLREVIDEMHTPPNYSKMAERVEKRGSPSESQEAIEKLKKSLRDTLITNQERFDLLVDSLSKKMHRGTIHKLFYQSIRDAAVKTNTTREDFRKEYNELLKDVDFSPKSAWYKERVPTKIGGKMIPLTREERISLAIHAQNESGRYHLTGDAASGFVLNSISNKALYHPTNEELDNLLNSLEINERKIIDLNDEITSSIWQKMNEVFKEKNGFSMGRVQSNYIHQQVSKDYMNPVIKDMSVIEELKNTFVKIGLYKGFTKDRVKSKAPIVLVRYFDALSRHIDGASAYIALEGPLGNVTRMLYDPVFRNEVVSKFGQDRFIAIEGAIRDLAGRGSQDSALVKAMNWIYNQYTRSIFGLNPKTFLKQWIGVLNATPYIEPDHIFSGLSTWSKNPSKAEEYLLTYSPWYRNRAEVGFSREISDLQRQEMIKALSGRKETLLNSQLNLLRFSDKQTVAIVMMAARHKKLSELIDSDLDVDEKEAEALKYAEEIAEITQNSSSVVNRSRMSLSRNPMEKGLTFGQGDSNTIANMILRNLRDFQRNPSQETRGRLIFTIFMAIAVTAPAALIDWLFLKFLYGSQKTDVNNIKKFALTSAVNQLFGLNYFGSLLYPFVQGIRTGRRPDFKFTVQAARPIEEAMEASGDVIDAISEDDEKKKNTKINKAFKSVARAVSSWAGIGLIDQAISTYERYIEFTPEEIKDGYKKAVSTGNTEDTKKYSIMADKKEILLSDLDKSAQRSKTKEFTTWADKEEKKTHKLSDDEFKQAMIERGRKGELTRAGANYVANLRMRRFKEEEKRKEELQAQHKRIQEMIGR